MLAATKPSEITAVIAAYLRQVDEYLPGLISGFYLAGSVAPDDYQLGRSDLGFMEYVIDGANRT